MNGIAPFQPKRRRLELSGRKEAQNTKTARSKSTVLIPCVLFFAGGDCEVVC